MKAQSQQLAIAQTRPIMASINYEIADGIACIASVFHAQFEDENGSKNEGTAGLAGLSAKF